jgi:tRNA-Thr(GGU) m(6)t(6)A37 methyltransferase TsaA
MDFTVTAVGTVHSPRPAALDDHWGQVESRIELDARFGPEALAGLESFSHLEVIYLFHQVDPDVVHTGARHPRNNPDWPKAGIFAQRARKRPNRLAVSVCEILGVQDRVIRVRGLDAIDGTPVLDLKPVMAEFLPRGVVQQPDWSRALMTQYFLD